jgi:AcrR family transcriptional regulator
MNDKILQAARTEFARKGYHRTVVSAVADRAGVGKGTVYRRFGDKKCLFTTLIRQSICDLDQTLQEAFNPQEEPVANLKAALEAFFVLYDDSRELLEIILTEGTQLLGMAREELKAELESIYGRIEKVFAQGIDQKSFRPFDSRELAFLLHRIVMSILESSVFYDYDPRQRYGSMLMDILLNGIQTREVTP